MKNKPKTIQEILKDPSISQMDKRIAAEKWKHNQLPEFYKKEHLHIVKEKIKAIKKEYEVRKEV